MNNLATSSCLRFDPYQTGRATSTTTSMTTIGLNEAWEQTLAADTPYHREALSAGERDAAQLQKTAAQLLALSQAAVRTAEASAAARRDLGQALAAAGGAAFSHASLAGSGAPPIPMNMQMLLEMFTQLETAESMQARQVESLLIEPLSQMLEEPRGLSSLPRLSAAYAATSHDFYEAINEYLALEGDGANASALKVK